MQGERAYQLAKARLVYQEQKRRGKGAVAVPSCFFRLRSCAGQDLPVVQVVSGVQQRPVARDEVCVGAYMTWWVSATDCLAAVTVNAGRSASHVSRVRRWRQHGGATHSPLIACSAAWCTSCHWKDGSRRGTGQWRWRRKSCKQGQQRRRRCRGRGWRPSGSSLMSFIQIYSMSY